MSQSNLLSLGRYFVVAIALALLAPYAGCHILTSPPDTGSTGGDPQSRRPAFGGREAPKLPSRQAPPEAPVSDGSEEATETREPKLSEIESLLHEQ